MKKLIQSLIKACRHLNHLAGSYRWRCDERRHGFPCPLCGARDFEDAGNKCRGEYDCPGDRMSKEVFKDESQTQNGEEGVGK